MKNSNLMFLLVAVFVITNLWVKFFCFILFLLLLKYKKIGKQCKKETYLSLGYGVLIIILNLLLNIDLNVYNFIYLVVCSFILKKIKIDVYSSLYCLGVLIIGVSKLWVGF